MKQWVKNWIADLSKVNKNSKLSLCPFAGKAWDQGAVSVVHTDNLWDSVHDAVLNFGNFKVVMCIQEEQDQEYAELEIECAALNRWFAYNNMDIWLLSSHREYTIIFVQRLSELDTASVALEKLGYYKTYKKEDYDRLILHRRTLRQSAA